MNTTAMFFLHREHIGMFIMKLLLGEWEPSGDGPVYMATGSTSISFASSTVFETRSGESHPSEE